MLQLHNPLVQVRRRLPVAGCGAAVCSAAVQEETLCM